MAYIYKITNRVNMESYIGATRSNPQKRLQAHKKNAKYYNSSGNKMQIVEAIRKYGEENFQIETLEECEEMEMANREKYWISLYDTVKSGYNSNCGGGAVPTDYNKMRELLIKTRSPKETAEAIGCSIPTVHALKTREEIDIYNGQSPRTAGGNHKRAIMCTEPDGSKKLFETSIVAAKYCILTGLTEADIKTVSKRISATCNLKRKTAYGREWRRIPIAQLEFI